MSMRHHSTNVNGLRRDKRGVKHIRKQLSRSQSHLGKNTLKAGLRMRIGCRSSGLKCVRIRVECKGTHYASQIRVL